MASQTSHTITLCLFLLLAFCSTISNASSYREYNDETYSPLATVPHFNPYKPYKSHRPGHSLKKYRKVKPVDVPSPNYDSESIPYKFMKEQNQARAELGLTELAWDDKLAAYAQNWANQRIGDCALEHSGGSYGENIFWGSGLDNPVNVAVHSWVDEKKFYDYYSNACMDGQDCGHYTQIIWKDSTRIGCAISTCAGDLGVFVTCNYDPPGNYIGARPY